MDNYVSCFKNTEKMGEKIDNDEVLCCMKITLYIIVYDSREKNWQYCFPLCYSFGQMASSFDVAILICLRLYYP